MQSKRPVTRSNSTFYLACLAGITAAGIAACAYALSSTAATSSTLATTLGAQAALTATTAATAAAAPALIPIIALTLLIGSLFLLRLMFSGNYAPTSHRHGGRRIYDLGLGDPTFVDIGRGYNPRVHLHGHVNAHTSPTQTYWHDTHKHGHATHVQGHDTHTHGHDTHTHGHDTNGHTHQHR